MIVAGEDAMRVTVEVADGNVAFRTPTGLVKTHTRSVNRAVYVVKWWKHYTPNVGFLDSRTVDFWRTKRIHANQRSIYFVVNEMPDIMKDISGSGQDFHDVEVGIRCSGRIHRIHVSKSGRMTLLNHENWQHMLAVDALTGERCRCRDVYVKWQLSIDGMLNQNKVPEKLRRLRNQLVHLRTV